MRNNKDPCQGSFLSILTPAPKTADCAREGYGLSRTLLSSLQAVWKSYKCSKPGNGHLNTSMSTPLPSPLPEETGPGMASYRKARLLRVWEAKLSGFTPPPSSLYSLVLPGEQVLTGIGGISSLAPGFWPLLSTPLCLSFLSSEAIRVKG